MAKPLFSSFFPLTALLFITFFSCSIREAASQENLINQTCKEFARDDRTIDFNFCTTSLQAAPASHCATLKGLGMMSIRLIRYNVTDTRCNVKLLLKNNPRWDPYVKSCLDACLELYSDAIDAVKKAMKSYNSKRFVDANVMLSAILGDATTCEDGFNEKEGVVSPLTKRNGYTFQLAAIALNVMHKIQTSD